jgi:hypothetical protein
VIENLSHEVTTEFLALITIAFLGGVLLDRIVVAGMRKQARGASSPFDDYPDRWVELLFLGAASATGSACLLRFAAEPQPAVLNTLMLLAAALDAAIVVLQLRWWSRSTRPA